MSLASAPAAARTCAGVFLAESVEVAATPLRLNGAGVRRVSFVGLGFDVYVAALYVKARSGDADAILSAGAPRRLVLHFVRRTERARLTDGLREAFDAAGLHDPASREELTRLEGWLATMESGQALAFTDDPDAGLVVEVAGAEHGTLQGAAVARAVFGHWLGAHAVDRRLEAGLLGGACG